MNVLGVCFVDKNDSQLKDGAWAMGSCGCLVVQLERSPGCPGSQLELCALNCAAWLHSPWLRVTIGLSIESPQQQLL